MASADARPTLCRWSAQRLRLLEALQRQRRPTPAGQRDAGLVIAARRDSAPWRWPGRTLRRPARRSQPARPGRGSPRLASSSGAPGRRADTDLAGSSPRPVRASVAPPRTAPPDWTAPLRRDPRTSRSSAKTSTSTFWRDRGTVSASDSSGTSSHGTAWTAATSCRVLDPAPRRPAAPALGCGRDRPGTALSATAPSPARWRRRRASPSPAFARPAPARRLSLRSRRSRRVGCAGRLGRRRGDGTSGATSRPATHPEQRARRR